MSLSRAIAGSALFVFGVLVGFVFHRPAPSASSVATPSSSVASSPSAPHPMGTTVTAPDGSRVTVLAWSRGAPLRHDEPRSGAGFQTVIVKVCPPEGSPTRGVDIAEALSLQMPDDTIVERDSSSYDGELESSRTEIGAPACAKGPVAFEVPGDAKPSYVLYGSSETRWSLPA